jgi:hypothetical protein
VVALFDRAERPRPDPARLTPGERQWWQRSAWAQQALTVQSFIRSGNRELLDTLTPELALDLIATRATLIECKLRMPHGALQLQLADLARFISVHLPPAQASAFWSGLARQGCRQGIGPADRRWLRLHHAVATADAKEMTSNGQALLEQEPPLSGALLAHALAAYMAGTILQNEPAPAMRALARHRARLGSASREWDPVLRFLVGQATRGDENWQRADQKRAAEPRSP